MTGASSAALCTRSMWPPSCWCSRECGSNAFMMRAFTNRDDRIVCARHDQRLLPHRGQREQAGPHRTREQLMQIAHLRSGMQLLQK